MLDMWHDFLQGNPILPDGLPDGLSLSQIALAVLAVPVALVLLHFLRVAWIRQFGRKYRTLTALNKAADFDKNLKPLYEYKVTLNSNKQLERFDFDRFFLDEFNRNPNGFTAILNSASKNDKQYRKYRAEVERLIGASVEVRFFDSLQVKLCKRRLLKPVTAPVFHCTAEYTSPKGKTHLTRTANYTVKQMEAINKQYLKNVAYKNSKAYQRSLMTDSLRYDIMKRDHFRCVLCGRTAQEGVKLHVDHIVPVAKGGLTVPENLRTLCDSCNLGKRDKYDPNGEN